MQQNEQDQELWTPQSYEMRFVTVVVLSLIGFLDDPQIAYIHNSKYKLIYFITCTALTSQ